MYQPDLTTHSNLMFVLEQELLILRQVQVIGAEECYPVQLLCSVGSLKSHVSNIIIKLIMFYL